MTEDPRSVELGSNLAAVHARIALACAASGRDPAEVTLVVVTKTWPAPDVRRLAGLGVRDVGENRDQEARPKHAEPADLGLRWHFVGQLQRNKAGSVATYADVVHSVDRMPLVAALDHGADRVGRMLDVFVQVDLDDRDPVGVDVPGRGGARPADVPALADAVAVAGRLRLAGVMAVAPLDLDPGAAFSRLAEVAARLRAEHPGADRVSGGMSHDLEAAVEHGATHVRVGSAVLGSRPPLG